MVQRCIHSAQVILINLYICLCIPHVVQPDPIKLFTPCFQVLGILLHLAYLGAANIWQISVHVKHAGSVTEIVQSHITVTVPKQQVHHNQRLVNHSPCGVLQPGLERVRNFIEVMAVHTPHQNRIHILGLWWGHLDLGGPFHQFDISGHSSQIR